MASGSAGTEMQRIVDEEDDARVPLQQPASRNDIWDWDKICAYRTNRVVRIQDGQLGCLYWSIVIMIWFYIQIVVIVIEGRHTLQEPGLGAVIPKFKGKGFGPGGKAFDAADLRFPIIEPTGAFLMTRRVVLKGQTVGSCIDWDSPQKCPCGDYGTCVAGNMCEMKTWCPSLGDYNVDKPPEGAFVEDITGLEEGQLGFSAGISFPSLASKLYVAGESPGSSRGHQDLTVSELLELAHPPIKYEDISKTGAIIAVNFLWNCDLSSFTVPCEPKIFVKRVDGGTGFVRKRAQRKTTGGVETRDVYYMYGLRIIVDSSGIGRRVSLVPIVIQLGSCLAMCQLASMTADFLMVRMYDKDRCDAYYRCKVVQTQDYSDLQERLDLVERQKGQARSDIAAGVIRSSGTGAGVSLGLGTGGQAGMTSVLRGRSVGRSTQ